MDPERVLKGTTTKSETAQGPNPGRFQNHDRSVVRLLDSIIPLRDLSRKSPRLYLPDNLPDYFDERSQMVVSSLYLRKHIFRKRDPDLFWPISSKWLIGMVGQKHRRRVLDGLLDAGVMECDWECEIGKKCFGYRLTYEFQNAQWRSHHLRNPELERNVQALRQSYFQNVTNPTHQTLLDHIRGTEGAGPRATFVGDDVPALPAQCLKDGQIFFRVDPHTGRVYSGYANLPNIYRKFVRLDGEEPYAVDITNSQPTLVGLAIGRFSDGGNRAEEEGRRRTKQNGRPIYGNCWYAGLNDFLDCCVSGQLYEVLRDRANAISATRKRKKVYDRSAVKERFFGAMYGLPCDQASSAVGQAFGSLWPEVFDALHHWKNEAHAGGHPVPWGAPAVEAQRIEAAVVIDGAVSRFLKEFPSAPCLTQHDCIITTATYVEEARRILGEEFRGRYGLPVPTKVGPWYDKERAARTEEEPTKPPKVRRKREPGEPTPRQILRRRFDKWAESRLWN